MLIALKILTAVVVAVAMAPALAHALELPGKLQLSKEQYLTVQAIYYPGFTFAGIAEPLGVFLLLILLLAMPTGTASFWLTAGAFAAIALMHLVYWLVTHPVNNFWLRDVELKGFGAGFFSFGAPDRKGAREEPDWTALRDRWEISHVVRAVLALAGLVLLVTAIAL